jgi:hypothetical protein
VAAQQWLEEQKEDAELFCSNNEETVEAPNVDM